MPPATGSALIILVAFVLPGFVTVLIQESTYRYAEDPTPLDRLLRSVYYSVWTYLLLAVVALIFGENRDTAEHLYQQNKGDPAELVWRGALVVLIPSLLIATATRLWYGSKTQKDVMRVLRINENHREPTGWDFFFRKSEEALVRVTLNDGGRIYGYYGSKSFAAYAKDGGDLFLERVYREEDEWFGDEAKAACGIWLPLKDIVCIEFYTPEDANSGETAAAETAEGNRAQTAPGAAGSANPT